MDQSGVPLRRSARLNKGVVLAPASGDKSARDSVAMDMGNSMVVNAEEGAVGSESQNFHTIAETAPSNYNHRIDRPNHSSTPLEKSRAQHRVSHSKSNQSVKSLQSNISRTSSIVRQNRLQAELEAAEAIAKIEEEIAAAKLEEKAAKLERQKMLIQKKLEVRNAEIDMMEDSYDEIEVTSSSGGSERSVGASPVHGNGRPLVDEWLKSSKEPQNTVVWQESSRPSNVIPVPSDPVVSQHSSDQSVLAQLTTVLAQAIQSTKPVSNSDSKSDMNKFMARASHGRDLPLFSGAAEEWANFISQFRRSTETCGFSNEENMYRLQKCLRDKAKEAVQAMLTVPENLDSVIDCLELQFGRPDKIVKVLIDKAKKMPSPKEDKFETLVVFGNAVKNLVLTMEHLKSNGHLFNPQLMEELVTKLPSHLQLAWGEKMAENRDSVLSLKDFSDWLYVKAKGASFVASSGTSAFKSTVKSDSNVKFKSDNKYKNFKREKVFVNSETERKTNSNKNCACCSKSGHKLFQCADFKKLSHDDKWALVKNAKVCFCCLDYGHSKSKCPNKRECKVNDCKYYHHELLHRVNVTSTDVVSHTTDKVISSSKILLRVAPVSLYGPNGELKTYALFDEGSTLTLLDSGVASKLGLKGESAPLNMTFTNASTHSESESMSVNCRVSGTDGKKYWLNNVRTVSNMDLPVQSVNYDLLSKKWKHLASVELPSVERAKPTILIGQNNIDLIVPREVIEGSKNAPILSNSKLGWTVHGNNGVLKSRVDKNFTFFNYMSDNDYELNELVKSSFKTEDFGVKVPLKTLVSRDEERANDLLASTTVCDNNRWTTGLLWKQDDIVMPPSRAMAEHRLRSLERKMDKLPDFAKLYCDKMQEYIDNGYARKLSDSEVEHSSNFTWYLPHFGVTNPNKPGKIRLVFDAAASSCNVSLNKMLLTGPDLYNPLPSVLCKFRQKKIAFGGDIKEMFLRVKISERDRQAQRFLWRGLDRSSPPAVYEMESMIFGASSSPCSAQFVKNKNASLYSDEFPEAAKAIVERHYMDDYLDSQSDESEAIKLISEVTRIHELGGFQIRNWVSNSSAVMDSIPIDLRAKSPSVTMSNGDHIERMLGLMWDTKSDCFKFNVNFHKVSSDILSGSKTPTKREVLRVVMSLFDPMGFLANFLVKAKILMQDVWRSGVSWDDEIPSTLNEKWQVWLSELDNVANGKVPRYYGYQSDSVTELHVFVDASEKAFAAVAYIRVVTCGEISVNLIMGKTRVSPLKPMSIPRLELQAAVMGCRLVNTVLSAHDIGFTKVTLWSDSKTVLLWLRSDARKYKPFVAHRVGEILESTDVLNWKWIPTKLNVADDATRDCGECDLSESSRWFRGPEFLWQSEDCWPVETLKSNGHDDCESELKNEYVCFLSSSVDVLPCVSRFSSYNRLIRATANVMRAVSLFKRNKVKGELTVAEIQNAELLWFKRVQKDHFEIEIDCLKKRKSIPKSSKLLQLNPFLDNDEVLRVKGRLQNAEWVNVNTKFPVILDPKHRFTQLLIMKMHNQFHHQGQETVLNELRQKFWILTARAAVRKAWNDCQLCKNKRVKPVIPQMGPIPEFRLKPFQRPFSYCGVDYFGPLDVTVGRRREKRWGVLFTCLTTRAIHLEVAHSLSSDSAIMAIRRLVGRRGLPIEMYSDNGTNFRGASKELRDAVNQLDLVKIEADVKTSGMKWSFNPPAAPHMGGVWERLVRSVKTSLHAILKEQAPHDETLLTLFAEVEAVVNSRPLTHVSVDPEDPVALTPSHFLLNSSSPYQPQPPGIFTDVDLHLRNKWRISQRLTDQFWKRWVREYLPSLTKRTRWTTGDNEVKVGDNAILCDPNCARSTWPRGIIVATFPGRDGRVRVVDIKTVTGTYRRPVANIAVLDLNQKLGEDDAIVSPGGRMLSSSSDRAKTDE